MASTDRAVCTDPKAELFITLPTSVPLEPKGRYRKAFGVKSISEMDVQKPPQTLFNYIF